MKKLISMITLMIITLVGFQGCDQAEMPNIGGIVGPGEELYGCEGANMYDWDSVEFGTSLDQGETVWLGFTLDETTLFNVYVDQAGFQCVIFDGCDGEYGTPPPIVSFETIGNGQEVGILTEGIYFIEITNTRNRVDFTFSIDLNNITYGCVNNEALNYNPDANVDDGSCQFNDCNTEWLTSAYGETILDCDGNCSPLSWIGDNWCDDGAYGVFQTEESYENYQACLEEGNEDCSGFTTPINLWCADLNWDEGDCDEIDYGCPEGQIEDCNGNCAPDSWIGDGYCDDGSYQFGGVDIFFNCEELNNDEGDCDGSLNRQTQQQPKYPNGRIYISK